MTLDDQGKVVQAVALSGNDLLLPDCLVNAKKWRFKPNSMRAAVIVYNLRREKRKDFIVLACSHLDGRTLPP